MRSIGILGGTFDPVHNGHLQCARAAQEDVQLDEVFFMPVHRPPHRPCPVATSHHRVAMLALATASQTSWRLDQRELEREGASYTIDSLASLRSRVRLGRVFMSHYGCGCFYAAGYVEKLARFIAACHIVVVPRAERPILTIASPHLVDLIQQHQTQDSSVLRRQACGNIWYSERVIPRYFCHNHSSEFSARSDSPSSICLNLCRSILHNMAYIKI